MAQQRSAEIKVGIFVVVCLAIVVGMILKFGKYERFAAKSYDITVVFPNVGGIVKDAAVLYGGIVIGKVREIKLDQEGLLKVNARLAIYEGVKIREDARFVINQSGLLGDRYVDVVPQSGTAPFIEPEAVVEGSSSVDLTEAIRGVVDVLRQAAGTIERVDRAVQRIDKTILSRESLDHISASMANIDVVTSNTIALTLSVQSLIEENRGKVENAFTKFSDAADNLNQTSKNVDQVVKNVDQIVTVNQDDIRSAVKNLTDSTERLNGIMIRLEQGEGTAGKILVDPTLHDEIVRLVQNWRKFGILYKEGTRKPDPPKRGAAPQPARPAQSGGGTLNFGTDSTPPVK